MSNFVPEGWTQISLPEVCYFQEGPGLRNWQYRPSGFPFINIRCIREGFLDLDKVQHISTEEALERYQHFFLNEGDYVLSSSGTLGRMAKIKKADLPLMLNTSVIRFRSINEDLLWQDFLPYYLQSPEFVEQITEESQGSAQVNFGPTHLKLVESYFPPLPEQQKIATILSSIDNVIEKTRAQIDKLKDLKTGMMQELLTKGIGHTEFKDSPVGWCVKKIDDLVVKVGSGITPRGGSASYVEVGIPLIRSQNVHSDGLRLDDVSYITDEQHQKMAGSQLKSNDVLLNITGASIGRCYYLPSDFKEGNVNQHVCIIRVKKNTVHPVFLTLFLNSEFGQKQIMSLQAGGNREGLNFQQIRSIKLTLPPMQEQERIAKITSSIETNVSNKSKKLSRLKNTKKALMQDLLTGKVRVNLNESAALDNV